MHDGQDRRDLGAERRRVRPGHVVVLGDEVRQTHAVDALHHQEQLAQMAKNLQEMEALDGAMADLQDAKNGMTGDGLNQLGDTLSGMGRMGSRMNGNGQNGLGRGRGQGDRPEAPDNTSTYTSQVKQQLQKGKAVATGTAPSNSPVKGHSVLEVQAEMATASGNAADALSNQKVPRNVEKHIRGYFDQINKGQ